MMRRACFPALSLLFVMTIGTAITTLAQAQESVPPLPCGNESEIARARAQALEVAAANCRRDLANGHDSCDISLQWKDLGMTYPVKFSAQEAEVLASRLRDFAAQLDAFDQQLAELRSHYDVDTHGTYVSSGIPPRCSKDTSVYLLGDRVDQCTSGCYRNYWLPAMDCWRDDIRLLGSCLAKNKIDLETCKSSCAQPQ